MQRLVAGLLVVLVVATVLVGAVVVRRAGWLGAESGRDAAPPATSTERPEGVPGDAEPAVVDGVVDGDTVRVRIDDPSHSIPVTDSVRVRLLNVDAPELERDDHPEECGGVEARRLLEQLLRPEDAVWLAPDVEDRDAYDRPLRYAFTAEGTDVQAALVEAGLAEVVVFAPNDRFAAGLRPLEARAREEGHGIWGTLCPA